MKRLLQRKKFWVALVLVLVIAGGIFWVIHNLNGAAVGTVNNQAANKTSSTKTALKNYSGKYLSFKYPSRYRQVNTQLTGQLVEVAGFYSTDHSQVSITITVQPEALSEDSGVIYRKQTSSIYKVLSNSPTSISFDNTQNGYEKDLFTSHGAYVASIVITAPSQSSIENDFNSIVSSFVWH